MTTRQPRPKRSKVEKAGRRASPEPTGKSYDLVELLDGMTPEAMHDAFDWGPDRGREVVE